MSNPQIAAEKARLRREVAGRLRRRGPAALAEAGVRVASLLQDILPQGGVVALYASRPTELSTVALDQALRQRRLRRAVPRIAGDDLVFELVEHDVALDALPRDRFGIPTPPASAAGSVALRACALVVVPGLAFDRCGGRLGYGRGFYDRALVGVAPQSVVGVLDDCQWVEAVPRTPQDVRLGRLCSPAGVVATDG